MADIYELPIKGTVKDWVNMSGDPSDPLRPVGLRNFIRAFNSWLPATPLDDRYVKQELLCIDTDRMVMIMSVEAPQEFLDALKVWYDAHATLLDIADEDGERALVIDAPATNQAHDAFKNNQRKIIAECKDKMRTRPTRSRAP